MSGFVRVDVTKNQRSAGHKLDLRGTQREYSSKQIKHSIVKRILVSKR